MNSNNQTHLSSELQRGEPGAYPMPFRCNGAELGSRLDSIQSSLRYWAVDKRRAGALWYNDMVQAHNRYEEWLNTQPPGGYPVPFVEGKRLDQISDRYRNWGIHPDRSSSPWYNFFVRANTRYEEHLAATRPADRAPLPWGGNRDYAGRPIGDVLQDEIWWTLHPSNHDQDWYQALYDANQRFLDGVYKSRSPGSELIWFGERFRGLRLDQVPEGFITWCLHPQRQERKWFYRFKDLARRFEDWQRAHPSDGPNPVGEAIGSQDDALGSADEDEYDTDDLVQSDSDDSEYMDDDDAGR